MASYQELKQRIASGGSYTTTSKNEKTTYEELKKKVYQERLEEDAGKVDTDYINNYLNSANDYFSTAEGDYSKVGWNTSSVIYKRRRDAKTDLDYRHKVISKWLDANKDRLDGDTYKQLSESLSAYSTNAPSVMDAFSQARDFYEEGHSGLTEYNAQQTRYEAEARKREEAKPWWEKALEYIADSGHSTPSTEAMPVSTNQISDAYILQEMSKLDPNDRWSDEQKVIFGYLWKNKGLTEASNYAWEVNTALDAQKEEEETKKIRDAATSNALAGAAHTAGAILSAPFGLADYMGDMIAQGTLGYIPESDGDVSPFEYSQAVTGGISENLNEKFGTLNEDVPIIGGKGWGDVYGLGVSAAQSAVSAATLGTTGSMITFFGSAAASAVDDAKARGATDEQALVFGAICGSAEVLTEIVPIDNLVNMGPAANWKGLLSDIIKQGGEEFLGESANSVITNVADYFVMGDKSEYEALKRYYIEEKGYDPEAAANRAFRDIVEGIAYDGLGGFATGTASAGVTVGKATAIDYAKTQYQNYQTGKTIMEADGGVDALRKLANEMAGVSSEDMQKSITRQAEMLDKKTTNRRVGKLFDTVNAANNLNNASANQADIAKSLQRKGFTAEKANAVAEALVASYNGQYLTSAQQKLLESVKGNADVRNAIDSIMYNSESTMGQRSQNIRTFENDIRAGVISKKTGISMDEARNIVEGKVIPQAENLAENSYEVSADGKTIDKDGNVMTIKGVASIKDGRMVLQTEGGTVDAKDVIYGNRSEALVYEAVANLGDIIDTETANKLAEHLMKLGETSSEGYVQGIVEAYRYGYYGYSRDKMTGKGTMSATLTEKQRNVAYGRGEWFGEQTKAEQAKKTAEKKASAKATADKEDGVFFRNRKGEVVSYDEAGIKTKATRETGVQTAKFLKELGLGGRFVFFESYQNAQGKWVYIDKDGNEVSAPNGMYYEDGTIYIDLNAGKGGAGLTLFTLSHELTHFIQQWSPAKYKALADFLIREYEKTGLDVDALVHAKQQDLSEKRGKEVSYDEAFHEMVADSMEKMFADGNLVQKLMKLKAQDNSLFGKIKGFVDKLARKIRWYYGSLNPDSFEGRMVGQMSDAIGEIQDKFAEALVEASENYQSSLTPGEEGVVVNESGDPVAYTTGDGTVQLSMKTYEDDGREAFRKYLQKCVNSNKLTKTEMQEMLDGIEEIYGVCKEFKDKFAPFSAWSDASVVRDTHGRPVFSVVTPNGDYKMNLDFSLVCKKRRTLDAVFNEMSRRGIIDDFELGQKSVVKINEIIRKYGLETACALCFVDAKRFRQASMADSFTRLYNELVESLVPEDQKGSIGHFNFSGYSTIKKVEGGIDTWDNSKLDFSHLDYVMKHYGKGTVEHKAAKYIKTHAEGRKLLLRGDFMSSQGFDAVKTQNKDILKLYNSKKGTGGPKAAFGDVQYMNEIIRKARTWTPAKAYAVGGVRIQSFSDYVPRMVFDYVQMIYDLAATKLPAHAYTKEALFVKQFGLTGIKINMSLIPAIAEGGIAPGLDANGNYVWAGESFDYETAKQIQNAEGYTENCGTICVGVSHDHIVKLLNDPNIRMVIPYHKSGLNPIVAHMNKIAEFTDYTNDQRTKGKDGKALSKDFDFSKAMHDMGENASPKAVADQYLKWCVANGYTARFAEFAAEENYYKLLEDFTLYDKDGNYVPQREVRAVFPKETDAFGSMKDLIHEGLEEDAIVEGKRDKNLSAIVDEIQKTLPKTEAEIAAEQVEQADRDLEAVQLSDRADESVSNRSLLANAFEGLVQNDIERNRLQEYKGKIDLINAEEQKLRKLNEQIKELSFAKGPRDTKAIRNLQDEATKTANRINIYDTQLLRLEASKPLQNVLEREKKKAYQRAEKKGKEALEAYRLQAEVKQSELMRDYRETRAALKGQKSDTAVMEKEFIRIAKAYEKLDMKSASKADKDAETIAALRDALKEEAREHQKDKNAWETEFNRLLKEYEAAGRNIEKLEEKIERQKANAKEKVVGRNKTAMRHKIQNVVKELNDLLLNESKKRHVPDNLKKAVAAALDLVNMDTVAAEQRVAKYAELIAKETDQDKIDAYTVTMENILRKGEKMGQRLKELHDAYEEIAASDDPDIANAHDPMIAGAIRELSQTIGNTSIRDMTIEQLSDVYDMYKMVLTKVRDANKAMQDNIKENISNLASSVVGEVKKTGGEHKYRAAILDHVRKFDWNNLKPVYAFERIGSATLTKVFNNVRAGEDAWAKDVTEARSYYLDKSKKYGYDSWDFKKKYRFESASGLEFELTLEQILSLYAYSKREQAHDHLRLGGFVFDSNIETYTEKGSKLLKYKVNTADAHQITPEILADITGKLTKEQVGFVDEMQDYLSTVMGAKGNEVTMKMYGVKLFKEKFYFPLKSAKQFMFEQNEVSGEVRIKNSGFTNKTVAKANNPVILSNFMDVWTGHVNDMSMYHAFTLPLEDFNRVFNYNSPKAEGRPAVSVKGTIQNAYSPAAVEYVKQLITDLNGGAMSDPRETFAKAMMSKFKKAKVMASLSVVIQQPSAIGRAFALVSPRFFQPTKDGMNHEQLWSELKKYAPVAVIKEMGYFDTNMGMSTKDFITAKEYTSFREKAKAIFTDGNFRDELLSKLPALADELTWCAIWNAVKRETVSTHTDLRPGSEEFLKAAGERFTEVVTKTQVYDSVLARSANMRSKSGMMNMATSFMAEPTTTINMLEDAIYKAKRGYKGYAAKVFASVATSIVLNNALVALVYAMRDDDEDETYLEKYVEAFVSGMLDDINPLTYYPFLKDAWSVLQGYDVERSDMSLISDLADSMKSLVKAYSSEDGDVAGAWWDLAGTAANIGGIPVQNIRREVNGVKNFYNTLRLDVNGRKTTWGSMKDTLQKTVRNTLPVVGWLPGESKTDKLYDAIVSGDTAYVNRLKSGYDKESSYNMAVRKALRENDPRIHEAAVARNNGDIQEYTRIAREIIGEGHFVQDDVVAAVNAEINAIDKGEAKSTAQKASGLYKAEDFATAISQNDSAMANAIKSDIIQTAQKNGKTEDEAKKSFNSSAKSELKEMFLSGQVSEEQAVSALVSFCGDESEDAEESVAEWAFESEHGFVYGDCKEMFLEGEISASELKSVIMDVEGKTGDEAGTKIVNYCRDAYEDDYFSRSEAASIMVTYGGMTRAEAEDKLRYIDVKKLFPDTYVDDAWVTEYYKEVQSSGITIEVFVDYRNKVKGITGKDKKEKRMEVIDSLPISNAQKDALYLAEGWAKSTLKKAPWH